MKKFLMPILVLFGLFITACSDDGPSDKSKEIIMDISSETGLLYDAETEGAQPVECMLVMTEEDPGVWHNLEMGSVAGFTYEKGHEYTIKVKMTILDNPTSDAGDREYSLISILYDREIKEPSKPEEKEIKSEADIEYHDSCPIEKYSINRVFTIDENNRIRDGYASMSYDMCRIYLENTIAKDDPDFVKYNRIPYQACYSYVISPFTDEIRLVSNSSDGPMFKDVVPENEFSTIVSTLKSGDEVKYVIVLANIYKKGLQRLEFSVKKE